MQPAAQTARRALLTCCISLLLTAVTAVLAGLAQAARVPAADPAQGDGGVSPFYTWGEDIPASPGQLLRSEPLAPTLGLAEAGEQFRILYSSTDGIDGKTPVVVSGAYFVPKGTPPAAGWPLVAWAHGTTGVGDVCAPSWRPRSKRDASYLDAWLQQGYAVVATDYQGLGTPGPHPYLAVRPEAYSVLDSVRAVLRGFPHVANQVVLVCQSQGGGATFAAAGIAPAYAAELNIRAGVATGVPLLGPPAPQPAAASSGAAPDQAASTRNASDREDSDRPDPTIAYALYIGIFMQQNDPGRTPEQLVTDHAAGLFQAARTTCVGALVHDVVHAG